MCAHSISAAFMVCGVLRATGIISDCASSSFFFLLLLNFCCYFVVVVVVGYFICSSKLVYENQFHSFGQGHSDTVS